MELGTKDQAAPPRSPFGILMQDYFAPLAFKHGLIRPLGAGSAD
jgi:hypothetical protein